MSVEEARLAELEMKFLNMENKSFESVSFSQ